MSRYTGPAWRLSRRLNFSTLETGRELARRPYAPGQHGPTKRVKLSGYGLQLHEKQKVRHLYGLSEKQFRNTFFKATKKQGIAGHNFLIALESRLDNVVYRLGLARTRRGARQLVNHGHLLVNGKKVDIPSYSVKPGQVISFREKSKNLDVVKDAIAQNVHRPDFVSFDETKMEGTYVRFPDRGELNTEIDEALIVEFYNRLA